MALRDQPYIPLYVQDFLTDEKLIECSAEATGVYIRLICILHKSEEYGKILLKQKDKQDVKHLKNFASKLLRQMPYSYEVIEKSLNELLTEGVIQIEGDYLFQKRMVRDNDISLKRSESGKKGGKKTQFASRFAKAKIQANTEDEYEYENEDVIEDKEKKRRKNFVIPSVEEIRAYCLERKNTIDAQFFFDKYTGNGWMVGKNKMKDWKAVVRTWEKNNFNGGVNNLPIPTKQQPDNFTDCKSCGKRTYKPDLNADGLCIKCENAANIQGVAHA
ncbi:MAG TPA: hypothetical protein PKM79_09140 [Smithellaceae bacterium]|nr:hypothetical protein [Smithellaceae bacterium]HQM44038.1 hypothetical protein [Smithellaceae bacterium]